MNDARTEDAGSRRNAARMENKRDLSYEGLFGEWRVADRSARQVEQELATAYVNALEGNGPPPLPELRARAYDLRRLADDLFHVAMAEMVARATSLRAG